MIYDRKKWVGWIFVLPFVVLAGLFLIYPFIQNVINMFFKFQNSSDLTPLFVGLQNFPKLFSDDYFLISLRNTAILLAFVIVFQMGIALVLALLVNSLKKCATIYRVLFFVPIVLSATTLGAMIYMFSRENGGLFNQILGFMGIHHGNWLPQGNWFAALAYVMAPVVWQYIGFYFVIMLTGLTNISDDILEAAELDGASGIRLVIKIMMPMMWNVFRTCMVLAITGALKVFDLPHVLAPGGNPIGQTYFMGTFNSNLFTDISGSRAGECAIYSVLMVLIGVMVSQISNSVLRENKDI